jgi:hypothetical protein
MRLSKKFAAIAITATVALTATAAFAYWSTGGAGTGGVTAAAGDASAITVHQTSVMAAFYPGQTAQALSGDFTSSAAGPVHVASVSAALGTLPDGCVAADFTILGSPATVDQDVSPGTTANGSWSGITIGMNNTAVSQDGCKGDSIPIVYTSN